jgi:uncharacterized membrane protein
MLSLRVELVVRKEQAPEKFPIIFLDFCLSSFIAVEKKCISHEISAKINFIDSLTHGNAYVCRIECTFKNFKL